MSSPVPEDLTPDESAQADYVIRGATSSTHLAQAAALGGAFLVYREYLRRRLEEKLKGVEGTDPDTLIRETQNAFATFMPSWLQMASPILFQGYLAGSLETGLNIDNEYLRELADNYAYALGMHLNETSADAIARGYAAQVNRKLAPRVALANVIDAFGVTNRTMRSLTVMATQKEDPKLSEVLLPSIKKMRAKRVVSAAIEARAELVGEQETWNAREQGKQVTWLYAQRKGIVPMNATRVWTTEDDERVCPVCGPLHKVEIPISERFESAGNKYWCPPAHPRCRCTVKLSAHLLSDIAGKVYYADFQRHYIEPDDVAVAKADDWEPKEHPRSQRNGRFVPLGQRDYAPAPTRERENLQSLVDNATQEETPGLFARKDQGLFSRQGGLSGSEGIFSRKDSGGGGIFDSGRSMSNRKMSGRTLKDRKLDPAKMKYESRMANAKMDGRIQASLGDLPGTVIPEQPDPKSYHEGLVSTPDPMFAIIDGMGIKTGPNRTIHLDGAEVSADLANLEDKIASHNAESDASISEWFYEDQSGEFMMDGRRFFVPEDTMMGLLAWERARQESLDELVGDDYISLPEFGWVNSDTGDLFDPETPGFSDAVDDGEIEEDQIDQETFSVSELVDLLGLTPHVAEARPQLVQLNLVRDNDVQYDANDLPYAMPVDRYRSEGVRDLVIGGRTYTTHQIEPDWLDDQERM